jgi:hypothetical protein
MFEKACGALSEPFAYETMALRFQRHSGHNRDVMTLRRLGWRTARE